MGDELDLIRAQVRYRARDLRRAAERRRLIRLAGCRRRSTADPDRRD
ncbi:MAG TPA: hypothetical protein VG756_18155 [Pseudonocardiaceae bacterium]|jgi:hypothetical protein|nr:hypothetical protein [Pseudonocardiaceae bacterium]